MFKDRTGNNCLSSTLINTQESLNETRNFTQQDIQIPSPFVNEGIVETIYNNTIEYFSYPSNTYDTIQKEHSFSTNNCIINS